MEALWIVVIALVGGGIAGTVLNVLATRLPADGEPSIIGPPMRPGSSTPDTRGLIPYLGAQMTGGGIDRPKLATEVAAALLIGGSLWIHGLTLSGLAASVFTVVLLLILRIDWQHHLIFSIVMIVAALIAFAVQALFGVDDLIIAAVAAVGAAAVFLILFCVALLIYGKRALGFGDIYLAFVIGAMTGIGAPGALLIGMFLAAAGGLFLIAIRVRSKSDYIPYGAYLCVGAIIVLLIP